MMGVLIGYIRHLNTLAKMIKKLRVIVTATPSTNILLEYFLIIQVM